MENIVRTVIGANLQTIQLLGLPMYIHPNSTLNEKFNIHASVGLSTSDLPTVKYITIGNGGHRMVVGANNIYKPEPIQHTPRDGALYNHLPFVLRLPNQDLTAIERQKYRLRRIETHDNVTYIAYYLKVLDFSQTIPKLELRSVEDGITTTTEYSPTLADLNPTPPAINSNGVLVASGDYIAATAKVPFELSESDITEFLNVCNIIYGDDNYAIISEMAICSGVDRSVVGDFNGVAVGYTDAIGVQVTNFINTFYAAKFNTSGISIMFDVGSVEPLLVLS